MSAMDYVRRPRALAAVVLCVALGLTGCASSPQNDATVASDASTAPTVDPDEDRVRLDERVAQTFTDNEAPWVVQVTTFENSEDPVVILNVRSDAEEETRRLTLGDTLELGAQSWRLSEIAISDTDESPGSATLVRIHED